MVVSRNRHDNPRGSTHKVEKVVTFNFGGKWYRGSIFLLIVLSILWIPLGITLIFKNGVYRKDNSLYYVSYKGRWGWVIFWSIIFFPIALLLFFWNGFSVLRERECG